MANKSVTFTEPVANDCISFQVRCDGAGNITLASGNVSVASDDAAANHDGNVTMDVDNLPAGFETDAGALAAHFVTKFNTDKGF